MDTLNNTFVRQLLLLAAIQRLDCEVAQPLSQNWTCVQQELEQLHEQGLLSIDSNKYKLSDNGKKTLVLWLEARNEATEHLKPYEQVAVGEDYVDARIGLEAFKNIGKLSQAGLREHLLLTTLYLNWDFLVSQIKRLDESGKDWQQLLQTGNIFRYIEHLADPLAWRKLGKTSKDAARAAALLLKPAQDQKELIQITRNADLHS